MHLALVDTDHNYCRQLYKELCRQSILDQYHMMVTIYHDEEIIENKTIEYKQINESTCLVIDEDFIPRLCSDTDSFQALTKLMNTVLGCAILIENENTWNSNCKYLESKVAVEGLLKKFKDKIIIIDKYRPLEVFIQKLRYAYYDFISMSREGDQKIHISNRHGNKAKTIAIYFPESYDRVQQVIRDLRKYSMEGSHQILLLKILPFCENMEEKYKNMSFLYYQQKKGNEVHHILNDLLTLDGSSIHCIDGFRHMSDIDVLNIQEMDKFISLIESMDYKHIIFLIYGIHFTPAIKYLVSRVQTRLLVSENEGIQHSIYGQTKDSWLLEKKGKDIKNIQVLKEIIEEGDK